MSRGPGRIEREIEKRFKPGTAWTVNDLCAALFARDPDTGEFDRAAKVSIRRAADKVCARIGWRSWRFRCAGRRGGPVAYYDPRDVMSYALARLKVDAHEWETEASLRGRILDGGRDHHRVVPGGWWWIHTQARIAEMDGDEECLQALRGLQDEGLDLAATSIKAALNGSAPERELEIVPLPELPELPPLPELVDRLYKAGVRSVADLARLNFEVPDGFGPDDFTVKVIKGVEAAAAWIEAQG